MDTTPQPTDEAVFERFLDGDLDAYRTLIDRYHDDLIRFLTRLVGDRVAADDIFQETFLQVHQSAHTFDTSRRFRPWLFTVAANKGRDWLRRKNRHRAVDLSAPIGGPGGTTSFVDLLEIDVPSPDSALDTSERDEQVQRALQRLQPALREVLLLSYFQRLSYQQIADDLGIPLGTVKSRMHAAVAAFARSWQLTTRENGDERA